MKLKYLKIYQKGIGYYLLSIPAKVLLEIASPMTRTNVYENEKIKVDLFNLEDSIKELNDIKIKAGIQRQIDPYKVDKIVTYLQKTNGIIPNSIILNLSDPLNISTFSDDTGILEFADNDSLNFTVIDGQHRLAGYKKYLESNPTIDDFYFSVTLFYNSELSFQAYVFSTINSTQTKINKSFLYDLLALKDSELDEFKLCHEIATWLHTSEESSLKGNFKMLGKGSGWLTQAAFIDYLMPLVIQWNKTTNSKKLPVFYPYYKQRKFKEIASFISVYFRTIKETFGEAFDSNEYIFRTSFIFGLFMKMMPYAYVSTVDIDTLKVDEKKLINFFADFERLHVDFRKGGENSGVGSFGKQTKLLNDIIEKLDSKYHFSQYVNQFRNKYF